MKTKIILFMFIASCGLFLTGCLGTYVACYGFSLYRVKRPQETRQKYGQGENIFMESHRYGYEDKLVKVLFLPSARQISFSIVNKTDHSIKIIWDEAAYVNEDNSSHRVMHSGIKFISRDQPQAPSVITAGSTLEDMVYPTDYAYYESGRYGGWRQRPLFPTQKGIPFSFAETKPTFPEQVKALQGKTFGVLLPLQTEGITNEYTFVFKITSAWIEKH